MQCYICGSDIGDNIGACTDCSEKRKNSRAQGVEQALNKLSYSRRGDNAKTFLGLGVVAFFLGIGFFKVTHKGTVPEEMLRSVSGAERAICAPGRECVVAYLTPWCGACKSTLAKLPQLRSITESIPGHDFELVVGQDSHANLHAFASKSRSDALLDTDGSAFRQLGTGGVPRFYRINSSGKITEAFSGYTVYSDSTQQARWIRDTFDLPQQSGTQ